MEKSESIIELSKALIKAQTELINVKCTKVNPYFKSKYAPHEEILNTVKPVLQKHDLAIVQTLSGNGETVGITTILMHSSGEYITDTLTLKPTKQDPQGAGSAITYGRRYSISAILNISSDSDDDGNEGSKKVEKKEQPKLNNNEEIINKIAGYMKSGLFEEDEIGAYRQEIKILKNNGAQYSAYKDLLDRIEKEIESRKPDGEQIPIF